MNWELLSVAYIMHQSRLQEAANARRARYAAPQRWQRLRDRLGDRLVAWGEALKTRADAPCPELRMAQPKSTA